jgi:serine/threonine protein kinase
MGCIIYKILTGNVPFTGTNQFLVFQKILNKEIEYPDFLSPEAVALIDAMLMIKPEQRLGSPDSKLNMDVLKKHPFFAGLDFSNPKNLSLTNKQIVLVNEDYESPKKMDARVVPRKSTMNISEFGNEDVVIRGYLKKKNRWF